MIVVDRLEARLLRDITNDIETSSKLRDPSKEVPTLEKVLRASRVGLGRADDQYRKADIVKQRTILLKIGACDIDGISSPHYLSKYLECILC